MQGFDAHSSISEHKPHKDIIWCARGELTKTRVGINKEIGMESENGLTIYRESEREIPYHDPEVHQCFTEWGKRV